jgi:hypothetical protein
MDNDEQVRQLCLSLVEADTEEEVIAHLRAAGYWDESAAWRFYGDYENNFNTIGNQQSRPDAALVEKLVNSVDARLMNQCLIRGVSPDATSAPKSIREAVALFFEDNPDAATAGLIREWLPSKRTEVAQGITLAATGARPRDGNPCFTISDCGEGQTPRMFPETFVSLTKSNKLRIPFVQGKFNMGGTGVLKFCGRHNLQLILSRRSPAILDPATAQPSDRQWGFTVVRREDPQGGRRSSVYTYLAPIGAQARPQEGEVLRFSADEMPIFPEGSTAYIRESEWGTLVKLYEYAITKSRSHILRKDGLLSRVDLLLPDVALPIRFHECREGYRGHSGSFDTTLTGLGVRLEDDRADNLEPGFPDSCPMSVAGEQMTATIYAFKKGKADTYRRSEGIIFTLNGQTHGHLSTYFFRRTSVGLSYLANSILVILDCSNFSGRAREDLFMNSRDRLSGGEFRDEIEETLEEVLSNHSGLRALKERRRREEVESKLDDSKPLEDILDSLLKQSPTLSALFLQGRRLSNPFKTAKVQSEEEPFEGKRYPTYFKFEDQEYGTVLRRICHVNRRCRITFETDVVNDYFSRNVDPGEFSLHIVSDDHRLTVKNYSLNLRNGIATLNLRLPPNCRPGDELRFVARVTDRTRIEPFDNSFSLSVKEAAKPSKRGKRATRKPPGQEAGDDRETPSGIQLPRVVKVYRNPSDGQRGWDDMEPRFDKYTALRVVHAGTSEEYAEGENGRDIYDFFLNVDNVYLKTELKSSNTEANLLEARFLYGMVLLGLGLLHQETETEKDHSDFRRGDSNGFDVTDKVEEFTRAAAPVLLPMIDHLGSLDLEDEAVTGMYEGDS